MADDNNLELSKSKYGSKSKQNDRGRYTSVSINYQDDNNNNNKVPQSIEEALILQSPSWNIQSECHDIWTSKKWWPNWFGFILAIAIAFVTGFVDDGSSTDTTDEIDDVSSDNNIFEFNRWTTDPRVALNKTNSIGISSLYCGIFLVIALFEFVTNFHDPKKQLACNDLCSQIFLHFLGYTIFFLIVTFCFFFDEQQDLNETGIGYTIFSILIGMSFTNIFIGITGNENNLWAKATKFSTKNCEFYIKVGLVLLATDLQKIAAQGPAGLIVAWIIPPLMMVIMWFMGARLFKITNLRFIITIAAGASICGTSAIAAVAPTVGLSEEDMAVAMGILTFFTMLYMVALPYICLAANLSDEVCGAWIGGSVDESGKVVASASIYDSIGGSADARETAVLIKISQNMLIGFVCLVLAVIWPSMVKLEKRRKKRLLYVAQKHSKSYKSFSGTVSSDSNIVRDVESENMNKCLFLWKKFPKFILGYLFLSIVLSILVLFIPDDDGSYSDRYINNVGQLSKWLFTLGFVGIGAKTKFSTLWESVKDGKYLGLYLVGQTIDTIITFVVAFVVFTYIAS